MNVPIAAGAESMPKLAMSALINLLFLATPVFAGYRFDTPDKFLASATSLPAWANTLERHAADRKLISDCLQIEEACAGKLRSLRHLILKGAVLDADDQLRLVNRYINRRQYKRDRRKISPSVADGGEARLSNHWVTLLEFLDRGGDCEDYATAKYFLLRVLGFEAEELRVLVTFDREVRQYHAVLAVRRADGSAWLLESDNTIVRSRYGQYRFIYAVNEHGIWDYED
jgi:predicted transglutaminase-like cysteine proteinase